MRDAARLCLNMIVRNESAIIERCLRSVAEHVACYVIGDTGSSDGTQDIVRRFFAERGIPGEIHEFPFENFEQARNAALDHALASPLEYDYLLLTDADMELAIRDPAFRIGLAAPCYSVLQNSGISYWNNRLLKRGAPGRYRGVTHEYLHVSAKTERLESVWFIDHANGSNRRDKLERDIRLLLGALESAPDDPRSWFYLAQTYRDAGRLEEAIEAFGKRADLGGWEEEAWQARWQQARCMRKLGDEAGFLRTALLAWNFRPHRAEPLYDLARYWREERAHDLACTYAELGMAIPWPERDALFIDDFIYSCGLASEYSIAAYYARQEKHRERGRELCDWLAMRRDIPVGTRNLARHNLGYYVRPASALMPSTKFHTPAVPTLDGHVLSEATLALRRGDLALLLRATSPEASARVVLIHLAGDLRLRRAEDVAAPPGAADGTLDLLTRDGQLWCLAGPAAGEQDADFVLAPLEAGSGAPMPLRLRPGAVVQAAAPKPRFILGYGPTLIVGEDGRTLSERYAEFTGDTFRPATAAVPFDGGWLAVVQESGRYDDKDRVFHRLIWIDADGEARRTSHRFDLRRPGTETVRGLALHPDGKRLVFSAVTEDGALLLATVPVSEARAALRPFPGEYQNGRHGLRAATRAPVPGEAGRIRGSRRQDVVLFRTHEWTPGIRDGFLRLVREAREADVCVCAYVAPGQERPNTGQELAVLVTAEDVRQLPYPGKLRDFTPARPGGGNDLPVLWFWRQFPGYARYWVVEYDVHYTGNWGALFAELNPSQADLLGTVIQDHDENPGWGWWPVFSPAGLDVPRWRMTRCFPPFVRLSSRALSAIDAAYRDGVAGHYEVTWATICRLNDLSIEEIGGDGRYTPAARRRRYYTTTPNHWTLFPGTFVYRPGFSPDEVRKLGSGYSGTDMLWHPVKP